MQYWVRKQGRVHNIYSQPVEDFDNPPNDHLVNTVISDSFQAIEARFPGYKLHLVEKTQPEPPSGGPRLSKEQLASQMEGMGLGRSQVEKMLAKPSGVVAQPPLSAPEASQKVLHTVYEEVMLQDKALIEFRLLLARYYANQKDNDVKLATQAVGSFILALWPDLEPKLAEAKQAFTKPKFEL